MWEQHAKNYRNKRYPIHLLKNSQDIPSTFTTMCDNYAEVMNVTMSQVYKVYVVNLTFLGSAGRSAGRNCSP